MHEKTIYSAGVPLAEAKKVLLLLHGRGAEASDMLHLATRFNVENFALFAPQATNQTWYPYSFLARPEENEPWLSSSINVIGELVSEIKQNGIGSESIYFAGFSQGACLTLEFVARNAQRFGGVAAFTGGLIGDRIYPENYSGRFDGTPIFIGTGNPDSHVPVERVEASVSILEKMGASVSMKVYDERPHTISNDEILQANRLIFN